MSEYGKTVMVYMIDKKSLKKEPIGMLRLARKEFAKTAEEAQRIVIGDFV